MAERRYRIGEAAAMLDLKTYVLRFWETEFPQLEPLRTQKGQRLYTQQHVDLLRRIKGLLYDRGMTIDGARRMLAEDAGPAEPRDAPPAAGARHLPSSRGGSGCQAGCSQIISRTAAELKVIRSILDALGEDV